MMKLILSLTLAWTLCSSAGALQCEACNAVLCSNTTTATCSSSETMCFTFSAAAIVGTSRSQQNMKACAPSYLCPTTGSQNFSFSVNSVGLVLNAECCNTDSCNSGPFHSPGIPADNSLKCCNDSQCIGEIQCRGIEDRCFQATVQGGSEIFGCASDNLCGIVISLGSIPFFYVNFGNGTSCCDTNLCNQAPTTHNACSITPGLIPLLLGLFHLI